MEIRNLRSFKCVVDEGSFVKAARRLHYTQSTITSHIQQLEEELQGKVFEKIGRKMHLSALGRRLLPHAEELLSIVERIEELSRDGDLVKGELKLAMGDSLVSYEFQDILIEYKRRAPQVKLSILTVETAHMRELLEKGEVDLGFLYKDDYKGSSLVDVTFREIPLVLAASRESGIVDSDFNLEDRSLDISFITNEHDSPCRKIFMEYLDSKRINLESLIEIWSIEGIKRSVKNGLGITYLPRFVLEDELRKGELVEIDASCSGIHTQGIYSFHKNKYVTPPMRLFMDLVNEKYGI